MSVKPVFHIINQCNWNNASLSGKKMSYISLVPCSRVLEKLVFGQVVKKFTPL